MRVIIQNTRISFSKLEYLRLDMMIVFFEVFYEKIRLKIKINETIIYEPSRSYHSNAPISITCLRACTFHPDLADCIQGRNLLEMMF